MKALLITAIAVVLILSLIFIPIRLYVRLCYNNDGFNTYYNIFYGFIRIKSSKKKRENTEQLTAKDKKVKKTEKKSITKLLSFVKQNAEQIKELIYKLLGYMFKHGIKLDKIDIKLIIGTEDAMITALSYGGVSAFIYNMVATLDNYEMLKKYKIELKPDFNNPRIITDNTAIISTNIFNAIVLVGTIFCNGLPLWRKYKKGCVSNGRKDENNG